MAEERAKLITRKDALKLIEENSGTARGLDLTGIIMSNVDLWMPKLQRTNLT